MSLLNIIFSLVILIGGMCLLAILVSQIRQNYRTGQSFRQNLAKRINQLRLSKMLKARGIDLSAYLHTDSINEIEQNMRTCENCGVKNSCDEELENENLIETKLQFCPNDESLDKAVIQIKQKTK